MAWKQASKYRHAVPKIAKREIWYSDLSVYTDVADGSHGIAASSRYFAVPSASSGQIHIGLHDKPGKVTPNAPAISAHSGQVTDVHFSPFGDNLLASSGDDGTVKVWTLPAQHEEDLKENLTNPTAFLKANSNRVDGVRFHPVAAQVLASIGQNTVTVWDLDKQEARLTTSLGNDFASLSWSGDGTLLATTNKDRKLRILDPRSSSVAQECEPHSGVKSSVVVWLGNLDKVFTTGFSKTRDREYALWDARNLNSPLGRNSIDTSTGVLIPLFDEDTNMLFIGGKGDGTIRWFELVPDKNPYFQWEGSPSVSNDPQRGLTLVPKRGLDVMSCEVNRLLKVGQKDIMPLQFNVARKTYSLFHDDLFPDTRSDQPALQADAWFNGENGTVSLVTLDPKKRPTTSYVPSTPIPSSTSPAPSSSSPAPAQASTPDVSSSPAPRSASSTTSHASTPVETPVEDSVEEVEIVTRELNIVRKTKYNYLAGKTLHPSNNYDHINDVNLKMPNECNVLEASSELLFLPLSKPGGQVGVIPVTQKGRQPIKIPAVVNGAELLDFAVDPFNPRSFATACDDGHIRIWNIPEGGLKEDLNDCSIDLKGHLHRVNLVRYHPHAANVVVSASPEVGEPSIRYWDVAAGKEMFKITGFEDAVFDFAHSYDGTKLAVLSKDKKLRIFNPRTQTLLQEGFSHEGARGGRVVWVGNTGFICTIGFDKSSSREVRVFKADDLSKCLGSHVIDISPSILIPYFDPDINVMYLWGRGDPSTHFVEITTDAPYIHYLTKFDAGTLQLGQAFLPKTTVDVKKVEVAKSYRLCSNHIEMISYTVPRAKMEYFQDDIFVPTQDLSKPVYTSSEWFSGVTKEIPLVSLKPADMKLLSEAPVEKKVRKYESRKVGVLSEEEKKQQVIDKMFKNVREEAKDEPLWQEQQQGVEESEWDDY